MIHSCYIAPQSDGARPESAAPARAPQRAEANSRVLGWWPVAISALGMLGLAWFLLPTAPGMGDSAELTLALALAGIAHPTGYPTYVLVGHLFVRVAHALGASWVVAAALWSASGAAVAIGACVRVSQHVLGELEEQARLEGRSANGELLRWTALLLPAAALALNPVWLDSATIAEVYSWHHACLALATAFMFGWLRRLRHVAPTVTPPSDGVAHAHARDREVRAAALWGLLCGLCGTQHATAVFFVVPMTIALLAALLKAGRWRAGLAFVCLGTAMIPLASYGWIAWRAIYPASFQWPVGAGLAPLWMHIRGASYTYFVGGFSPDAEEWALIRGAIMPWAIPGILLGIAFALSTRAIVLRRGLLALVGAATLQLAFIAHYGVSDPATYFVPVLMQALLVLTPGVVLLGRRVPSVAILSIGVVLWGALAAWSIPRALAGRTALRRVDMEFRAAWRDIPARTGIVLWADDHFHRFVLLQLLEGQRRDVYVDNPDMLLWPVRRRAFQARFGFDPIAGITFRTPADIQRIARNVQQRASVPVVIIEEAGSP